MTDTLGDLDEELQTLTDEADDRPPLFVDIAALLAGGLPEPPQPVLLHRTDGICIFYARKVNVLYGDPECGKTWIALAAIAEALNAGRRCVFIDLDHNGAEEVVARLLLLGAKPSALRDPALFHFAEPEDAEMLLAQVAELRLWRPAVAALDSIGELLPLLNLSSNSPDDYTKAHRWTLKPLAAVGAAVIGIDHMPKGEEARQHGQTGTFAKKRTVNGVTLHVTIREQFAPGRGGSANLTIAKDRPGGLRGHCPAGKRQPAGRFVMRPLGDGVVDWIVTTPKADDAEPEETGHWKVAERLAALADELGLSPAASRRAITEAVLAKHPNLKHGTAVWNEAAQIRKRRSEVVRDQDRPSGPPDLVPEIKTKAA